MHILFMHQNFPAQFGHVAKALVERGWRCTFVTEREPGHVAGIEKIQYRVRGGATAQTHFCSRTFENAIHHTHAVFEALKARPDIQPDLIVGHSGFGSTLFLRELYDCPIINYFEYFYGAQDSDLDFRPEFAAEQLVRLRARARNAMLLLDLNNCDAGYAPTKFQHARLPQQYHEKIRVIFDGVDTSLWHPIDRASRVIARQEIPADLKIVSYVSRGFESMRGFDLFMQFAKRLAQVRRDVLFVVVGEDRVCYGGDERFTDGKTFKDWVLAQDDYDLSRFLFLGRIAPQDLANLFSLTDLHVYWTVPFVLSWSVFNALACGAPVLASDTSPVREVIRSDDNGRLVDFFDVDGFVQIADKLLNDPEHRRRLGTAAQRSITENYSLEVCLPEHIRLFESVLAVEP